VWIARYLEFEPLPSPVAAGFLLALDPGALHFPSSRYEGLFRTGATDDDFSSAPLDSEIVIPIPLVRFVAASAVTRLNGGTLGRCFDLVSLADSISCRWLYR
jgi:hypothetical protein